MNKQAEGTHQNNRADDCETHERVFMVHRIHLVWWSVCNSIRHQPESGTGDIRSGVQIEASGITDDFDSINSDNHSMVPAVAKPGHRATRSYFQVPAETIADAAP